MADISHFSTLPEGVQSGTRHTINNAPNNQPLALYRFDVRKKRFDLLTNKQEEMNEAFLRLTNRLYLVVEKELKQPLRRYIIGMELNGGIRHSSCGF
ncbi:hypothetical protein [Endozoicomonas montiporae]|uniref:hypothetical protein n=1 Tax=Endozoicomonas montiporae TaxID=1027273 RepID=UPI00119E056B|nr:hypothetical protein [Endozoicomonas montiporae]